jgi:hypothetical protein
MEETEIEESKIYIKEWGNVIIRNVENLSHFDGDEV